MAKGISKIEFNDAGFKAILQADGTKAVVQETADRIATNANINGNCEGFKTKTILGTRANRYVGFVNAATYKAVAAESENKALTRAVHK